MRTNGVAYGLIFLCCTSSSARADDAGSRYPAMAPIAQYLSPNGIDEVALARSAAPKSISENADILTLSSHGYDTAVKGTNGFVCLVERSWAAGFADAEFWNPSLRAPICHNGAAAHTILPGYIERTGWVLAGVSTAEMIARTRSELSAKTSLLPEAGAMSYMMSKQAQLHDADGHWHPHLMFYLANTAAAAWGANLKGSPIFADASPVFAEEKEPEPVTTFFVPVTKWSDGTAEMPAQH
jgi:hypothetical protein